MEWFDDDEGGCGGILELPPPAVGPALELHLIDLGASAAAVWFTESGELLRHVELAEA